MATLPPINMRHARLKRVFPSFWRVQHALTYRIYSSITRTLNFLIENWYKFLPVKTLNWNSGRTTVVGVGGRDGFRERGALGHLSLRGPKQVWPVSIWPFIWKAWTYAPLMCSAPSKIYLLLCRLCFCICLKCSTEIKAFLTFIAGITRPEGRRIYLSDSEVIYLYMGLLSFLNPGSSSQKLVCLKNVCLW